MSCPNCGSEAPLLHSISPTGMVASCGQCAAVIAQPVQAEPAPIAKAERNAKPAATGSQPLRPENVIRMAKDRARFLRRSITALERSLKADRRELEQLTRLLDAAEARPRAVVRPIRTTA